MELLTTMMRSVLGVLQSLERITVEQKWDLVSKMGKWIDVSADVMLSKLLPDERRRSTVENLDKRVMQLSDIVAENMFESMLDFRHNTLQSHDFEMQ